MKRVRPHASISGTLSASSTGTLAGVVPPAGTATSSVRLTSSSPAVSLKTTVTEKVPSTVSVLVTSTVA
ncbi:hypothetical protein [Streptomyces sp. NPDC093808]|uniref:hypothetical protein n=1 Tax=Streptomyces sp. NPDC093808 TaxID=3154985 RepID=UPI00344F9B2E